MSLKAENLSVGHGPCAVVTQVTFELQPGQALCLLGPNGSGKSTLLKTLLGILPPLQGELQVDGEAFDNLRGNALARQLAYVPQHKDDPFAFACEDVVLMARSHQWRGLGGALLGPRMADREAAHAALARLGIAGLAKRAFNQLSGGQQQLVLMARALCQNSRYILLDEPTASLDFANAALVMNQLEQLLVDGEHAVLWTSHDPQQALHLQAQVMLLHKGSVLAQGAASEVIQAHNLSLLYNLPIDVVQTASGPWIRATTPDRPGPSSCT
ncbi:ABC transporter ATP-binding protein [Limnobacter humi]|uniref:ABC transporter ATP-binding protein n=1 Tax=Limnobacter humi TaxID=1778671 RepID=A0ABT1WHX1_9BURK|nr:ABC transporter ATP-binding protein [Limnobacter humi]MCQ8896468.1 ABC transporter ATP-binding protein [Limnobacter humi]